MTTPLETAEVYYGTEANYEYMSASQLKSFLGTPGISGCEERALADISGQYVRADNKALTIGSYVDVMLTGTEAEQHEFRESIPRWSARAAPPRGSSSSSTARLTT